jgi:LPXTG-motif cell wall-anchored protein
MIRSNLFRSALALLILLLGTHTFVQAQTGCVVTSGNSCASAPEIDPSLGASGVALLAGAVLVLRSRRRS